MTRRRWNVLFWLLLCVLSSLLFSVQEWVRHVYTTICIPLHSLFNTYMTALQYSVWINLRCFINKSICSVANQLGWLCIFSCCSENANQDNRKTRRKVWINITILLFSLYKEFAIHYSCFTEKVTKIVANFVLPSLIEMKILTPHHACAVL